ATLINITSELPPLDDGSVTIDAQNQRVGVNGAAAGAANGLTITSSGNRITGLHILNFTRDGIFIADNAANNIIGGDRGLGSGPNGQGLRVSGCGAYGIHVSGATAN